MNDILELWLNNRTSHIEWYRGPIVASVASILCGIVGHSLEWRVIRLHDLVHQLPLLFLLSGEQASLLALLLV